MRMVQTQIDGAQIGDKVQVFAQVHGFSTAFRFGAGFLLLAAIVTVISLNVGKDSLVKSEAGAIH